MSKATFAHITSVDHALAAVPTRRAFTNPDGTPAFRAMLAHMRGEAKRWRDNNRVGGRPNWRKIGGYGLRTIGAKLRHLATREEIATGWHPLRATADAFDAVAEGRKIARDDISRAFAILALAAGRPAVVSRCHNGCFLTDPINRGDASPADLAASPLALAGAVALNAAAERFIAAARALAAPAPAVIAA
jgi:hypothetical protein